MKQKQTGGAAATTPEGNTTARLSLQYVPLHELTPATRNPKRHAGGLRAAIERFGFADPIEIDQRTGRLVAGHGRLEVLQAMHEAGRHPPQWVDTDEQGTWLVPVIQGWTSRSDADAEAYLLANNQLTIAAGWDEAELAALVEDLQQSDPTLLEITGFTDAELESLLADMDSDEGPGEHGEGGRESTQGEGELINLAGVTVGEPDHPVERGQVWRLGERHVLAVACPHTQWPLWTPYLDDGAVLLPYPSPHAALAETPGEGTVVLVQPNTYLAGWLVTKWVRATGGTPELVQEGSS